VTDGPQTLNDVTELACSERQDANAGAMSPARASNPTYACVEWRLALSPCPTPATRSRESGQQA